MFRVFCDLCDKEIEALTQIYHVVIDKTHYEVCFECKVEIENKIEKIKNVRKKRINYD